MCWSAAASVAMTGAGAVATVVTVRRGVPLPVPLALGYFTVMEALQAAGYAVVDECANPANQSITLLSYLHIAFQPLVINAFLLEMVPAATKRRAAPWAYGAAALSAVAMLMQLYPFDWAGSCRPGSTLCAERLCLVSGNWHIAWGIPYNGLLLPIENWIGTGGSFPTYLVTVFLVPIAYGAWRFVLFHALAGPVLATLLTSNPNEMPAVWCLFSVGIVLISLSPALARRIAAPGWRPWPGAVRG